MRVLLVEDDELIIRSLEKILAEQHYVVDVATDGQIGWAFVEAFNYDIILLDILLPKLDGIQFCQKLRAQDCQTPVLMLTAQNSSSDRVIGLDAGADDYVVKPFEPEELLARLRVLSRRKDSTRPTILKWLNLHLDPAICEVTYKGNQIHLTPKEYRLLELFLRNPHRVFSRGAILDHLWSCEEPPGEDTVTVHIKDLRQKLKLSGVPTDLIATVYGQGYRLKPEPDSNTLELRQLPAWMRESLIQQRTKAGLSEVWKKHQGVSHDRCLLLEQVSTALHENQITDEQRHQACRAAHQLAGALGIFGFAQGSRLAKKIEHLLQTEIAFDREQTLQFSKLVTMLRRSLQETTPTSSWGFPLLLVVDNDIDLAERMLQLAGAWGISMALAPSLSVVKEAIWGKGRAGNRKNYQSADVLVVNLCLSSASDESLALLTELTNQIPPRLVLFLSDQDQLTTRIKIARLGAHVFLPTSELESVSASTELEISAASLPDRVLEAVTRMRSQIYGTAPKVMVVDDDPQILAAIEALLEPWGLQLAMVEDPRQFWQTLQAFSPDLLVMDVKMPHFSGIELCQVVRNSPEWENLPVVFFTAHPEVSILHQALIVGADGFVSKATEAADLVALILNRLGRVRLRRSLADLVSG